MVLAWKQIINFFTTYQPGLPGCLGAVVDPQSNSALFTEAPGGTDGCDWDCEPVLKRGFLLFKDSRLPLAGPVASVVDPNSFFGFGFLTRNLFFKIQRLIFWSGIFWIKPKKSDYFGFGSTTLPVADCGGCGGWGVPVLENVSSDTVAAQPTQKFWFKVPAYSHWKHTTPPPPMF
jgi:hypothetical protein